MRLLMWLAVCLGTVDLVCSDMEFSLNISKPFGGIFDNLFKLPPLFDLPKKNPSTENPSTKNPFTAKPSSGTSTTENTPKETHFNVAPLPPIIYTSWGNPVHPIHPYFGKTRISSIHEAIIAQKPDEDTIIRILTASTPSELVSLRLSYQMTYQSDLVQNLKNILTGELEEAVISWIIPREQYYAREIHSVIYGIADERALIDTLCVLEDAEIYKIDSAYSEIYHRSMGNDLTYMLSKSFGRLLYESSEFQPHQPFSSKDVEEIVANEVEFVSFLVKHSFSEIFKFAMEYHKQSGKYLENTIMKQYSGDLQRALLSVVHYAKGEKVFLVRRLHESLEGDMVDHHSLIRLAIMDKKVSYDEIRDFYRNQYKKDLDEVITKKIASVHFRKFIQALFNRKQYMSLEDTPMKIW